ncbi:MAG: type II toxin-antitoxin system VapC family toxin [Synechococcus sp.]
MAKYLLDTNVLLRLVNSSDRQHLLASEAVAFLLGRGDECWLTSQVLIEFWVVATRPTEANGLGWSVERTHMKIVQLLEQFPLLQETENIFPTWLRLVADSQVKGKRTHDARIAAVAISSDISHILTLNPKDFSGLAGVKAVSPEKIADS